MNIDARNEAVSVGTNSTTVSSNKMNTGRKTILITNTSTAGQVVSLAFGFEVAVLGEGINLPAGASVQDTISEGYMCYQGPIQAIASAADATLSIFER